MPTRKTASARPASRIATLEAALKATRQKLRTAQHRYRALQGELAGTAHQRVRHLLSASPAVLYVAEPGGTYPATFMTENVKDELGYDASQFIGDPQFWLNRIHHEDRARVMADLPRLFEHDRYVHEYRFRHSDGSYRWMRDELRLVRDERGNPVEIVGFWVDISDHKEAEREIERLNAELERRVGERTAELESANRKLQREMAERRRVERALRAARERFRSLFRNAPVGIYRTTPDGRILMANPALVRMLGYPSFRDLVHRDLELEGYEPGYARAEFKDRIERDGAVLGLESAWTRHDGAVVHVRESATAVRDESGKTLYYEGTVEDITGRKLAERALHESQERHRRLVESAPEVIFTVTPEDGTITSLNAAFADITGWDRADWIGKPFAGLVHPEDVPVATEKFLLAAAGEVLAPFELRFLTKSRDWLIGQVAATVEVAAERVCSIVGFVRNVTESRQAEDALRDSEERYRRIVEDQTEFICRFRPDGTVTFANEAVARFFGTSPDQLVGHDFLPNVLPEDRQKVLDNLASLTPNNPSASIEDRCALPSGEVRWLHWTNRKVFDADGRFVEFQAVGRDVTRRRQAEEALAASEARYRTLFESSLEGIGVSRGNRILDANRALLDIFGYDSLAELAAVPLLQVMAPEARPLMAERIRKRDEDKPVDPRYESVILRKNGERRIVEISTSEITIDGQHCVQSTFRDITERRRAEERLRDSEARYRTLFEQAADAVLVIDPRTGAVLEFNDRAHEYLGYTRDEFKRVSLADIEAVESPADVAAHVARTVETGSDDFETRQRTKTGELRDVHVRARCVRIQGRPFIQSVWRDVTDEKRAEEALRESEQRYRAIYENIPDPVTIHEPSTGKIVAANPAMRELWGYTEQEISSGTISILDLVRDDERNRMADELGATDPADGLIRRGLRRGQTKAGGTIWVDTTATSITLGGRLLRLGIARDMTEAVKAREQVERQALLLANVTDAVFVVRPDLSVTYWGPGAERLFGYPADEMLGLEGIAPLLRDPASRDRLAGEFDRSIRETGAWAHHRLPCCDRFGNELWVNVRISFISREEGFLIVGRDVTEEVRLQERLFRAARMSTVGTLALSVTHELNNLLGGLRGLAESASSDPALAPRLIDASRAVAERGGTIAGRLASLARADAPGAERRIDMPSVVHTVVKMMEPSLAPRRIVFREHYTSTPPTWMNEGKVLQVLINLISNARDSIGHDGHVDVSVAHDDAANHIVLTVRDTGAGISDDDLPRIFGPFFTTKTEPDPETGVRSHLGLGLAETLSIVSEHGGTIDVKSAPGRGAAFTIRLPIRSVPTAVLPPRPALAELPPKGTPMLIADDDELMRTALTYQLAELEYDVAAVANGREAVDAVRSRPFDFVFLDILMPGEVDAAAACRQLRELRPGVKIIVCTAYAKESIPEECRAAAFAVLKKPFSPDDLARALAGRGPAA